MAPPHSSQFLSHRHTPSPFLHPTAGQGSGTGMRQIRLNGEELAAGIEASPILHRSPQGGIQRDSDSDPGSSPARAALRMEKSDNFLRTSTARCFF